MSIGIQPDILICRTEYDVRCQILRKIRRLFTNVEARAVVESTFVKDAKFGIFIKFHVLFMNKKMLMISFEFVKRFGDNTWPEADLSDWDNVVEAFFPIQYVFVCSRSGKYVELPDARKVCKRSVLLFMRNPKTVLGKLQIRLMSMLGRT